VLDLWSAYFRLAQIGWDANAVVAMRLMRLASGGALAQREAQRMIAEKAIAAGEAQTVAAAKMLRSWNQGCDEIGFSRVPAKSESKSSPPESALTVDAVGASRLDAFSCIANIGR